MPNSSTKSPATELLFDAHDPRFRQSPFLETKIHEEFAVTDNMLPITQSSIPPLVNAVGKMERETTTYENSAL